MAFKGWDEIALQDAQGRMRSGVPLPDRGKLLSGKQYLAAIADQVNKPASDKRSVRGYGKTEVDGIVFDSKLEAICYRHMKSLELDFTLKPVFELLPAFEFYGEKVRPWTHSPDFMLSFGALGQQMGVILEVKGYADARYGLKLKMLKMMLTGSEHPWRILFVHLQKDVAPVLDTLSLYAQTGDAKLLDWLCANYGSPDSDQVKQRKKKKRAEAKLAGPTTTVGV